MTISLKKLFECFDDTKEFVAKCRQAFEFNKKYINYETYSEVYNYYPPAQKAALIAKFNQNKVIYPQLCREIENLLKGFEAALKGNYKEDVIKH